MIFNESKIIADIYTESMSPSIPEFLYHASYRPVLNSIMKFGLGSRGVANWEDSQPGVVYLSHDPNVAESYAESSDVVAEEWLDNIIILKISTSGLNSESFYTDSNVLDNMGDTVEYHGVIPPQNIRRVK